MWFKNAGNWLAATTLFLNIILPAQAQTSAQTKLGSFMPANVEKVIRTKSITLSSRQSRDVIAKNTGPNQKELSALSVITYADYAKQELYVEVIPLQDYEKKSHKIYGDCDSSMLSIVCQRDREIISVEQRAMRDLNWEVLEESRTSRIILKGLRESLEKLTEKSLGKIPFVKEFYNAAKDELEDEETEDNAELSRRLHILLPNCHVAEIPNYGTPLNAASQRRSFKIKYYSQEGVETNSRPKFLAVVSVDMEYEKKGGRLENLVVPFQEKPEVLDRYALNTLEMPGYKFLQPEHEAFQQIFGVDGKVLNPFYFGERLIKSSGLKKGFMAMYEHRGVYAFNILSFIFDENSNNWQENKEKIERQFTNPGTEMAFLLKKDKEYVAINFQEALYGPENLDKRKVLYSRFKTSYPRIRGLEIVWENKAVLKPGWSTAPRIE